MRTARIGAFVMMILCTCGLCGCSLLDQVIGADDWKDWTPDTTSLRVYGDGSVTETIFDSLDQTWYQGNELQDMIARSMNEYNETHGDGAINVTSYSDEGGKVQVEIDYRTGEDFAAYNNTQFCSGSMLDAQMEGFLFEGSFYETDKDRLVGEAVDSSEPLSHKEYSVVISDGTHVVQVPGEIRYVSAGAQLVNSHVAKRADAQTDDSSLLYVIYEMDQSEYTQQSE